MKKLALILAVALMVVSLGACKGSLEIDPNSSSSVVHNIGM